jgi:diguanylate cyclase (GGDEF)-like protein/PAS domain S-box-containing protein
MQWHFVPYVILLFIAAGLSIALAVYAWRRRIAKGGKAAFWLLLAITAWSLFYALELMSQNPPANFLFHKLKYFGVISVPLAFLIFALEYTGQQNRLSRRWILLLTLLPLITLLLIWTNEAHGLIWGHEIFHWDGLLLHVERTYGVWFWVHVAYSYLMLLAGTVLLARATIQSSRLDRWPAIVILAGVLVPWLGNALHLFRLGPWPNLDLTPLAFTWTGLVIIGGLLRFQFFDLVPVARNAIVQSMSDGMFVLDLQDRIIDINTAAEKIIGSPVRQVVGGLIGRFLPSLVELLDSHRKSDQSQLEVPLDQMVGQTYYDVKISPLADRRGRLQGRLVVLRDITQRKQAEEKLQILAITDPLTGIFNRRHFFNLAEKYFQQAQRTREPLSTLMIDIDHFKLVNDLLGHAAGDLVLMEISSILAKNFRSADILARFGGEEFVVLMSNTSEEYARLKAEHLCQTVSTYPFQQRGNPVSLTISVGVATLNFGQHQTIDKLIDNADQALYKAKQAGRNRAMLFDVKSGD